MKRLILAALAAVALVPAQPAPKSLLGMVTEFKVESLEIGIKPDSGNPVLVKIGPRTEVVRVPPGERDLNRGKAAKVTDIARGDRVLVSFVDGLKEARRIVLISGDDIAARNEAEKLDWQKRGLSGLVASKTADTIVLEIRTPQGPKSATITVTGKTILRRYAPDSIRFADAERGQFADIAKGDQLRVRGTSSEDGSSMTADELVFGTFLTRLGPITAVNRQTRVIDIQELTSKQSLRIRITEDSQLKMMPDMRAMFAGGARGSAAPSPEMHEPPPSEGAFDMARMLQRLPSASLDDLKVGGMVIVTSTRGTVAGEASAIMVLANADFLIQMAQKTAESTGGGVGGLDFSRLHGGMLTGPGGLSLPAMIQ